VALLLLVFAFAACAVEEVESPTLIRPAVAEVVTITVERGDVFNISARRQGVTRYLSQPVFFENPVGAFDEFHVRPGDFVTAGQLLASLDNERLDEQIEEQLETIATMRHNHAVAYELRQLDIDIMVLDHGQRLMAAAHLWEFEMLETVEFNIERARLELRQQQERQALQMEAAEARLHQLQSRRGQIYLQAPMDGQIVMLAPVSRGSNLFAGQHVLYITDTSEVIIEAVNLPSYDWPPPPGAAGPRPSEHWIPVSVRQANYIYARIDDSLEWVALEYIEVPSEDRNVSGVPSRVRFRLASGQPLTAGSYADIMMYTQMFYNVLRIPSNALFIEAIGGYSYVYRIVDGELVYTPLVLYGNTGVFAAVRSGLEEGDEIFVRP